MAESRLAAIGDEGDIIVRRILEEHGFDLDMLRQINVGSVDYESWRKIMKEIESQRFSTTLSAGAKTEKRRSGCEPDAVETAMRIILMPYFNF